MDITRNQAILVDTALEAMEIEGIRHPFRSIRSMRFWREGHLVTAFIGFQTERSTQDQGIGVRLFCDGFHRHDESHNWTERDVSIEVETGLKTFYRAKVNEALEVAGGEVDLD